MALPVTKSIQIHVLKKQYIPTVNVVLYAFHNFRVLNVNHSIVHTTGFASQFLCDCRLCIKLVGGRKRGFTRHFIQNHYDHLDSGTL